VLIELPKIRTPKEWCDFYGVEIYQGDNLDLDSEEVVTLYKGVDNEYRSSRNFAYVPGTVPIAPDWDGGEAECGGGLHFSPQPFMTLQFAPGATKFVACPVALRDIVVRENPQYPTKVKARKCCGLVYEVTIDGERIDRANS
jgi:hypothetical protein